MYYEIQYYCIGNIVRDRNLTFNNKEYMVNLHIDWNIIYFYHLEKTIYTENFSIMIATNFNNLMSVVSLVGEKSSLCLRIFCLT